MEIVKTPTLMLFAAALVFLPKMEAQQFQHPLCVSQVALVNYACAMLPYIPLPPLIPPIRPLPPADPSPDDEENGHGHVDNHGHSRDQNNSQGPYRHEQGPGHGHGHEHEHEHGHKHGHGHNHSHGHGQEHRHRHRHHESHAHGNCCRWLNELDDECVCDMLVRLPSFLSRHMHTYTLYLDETCNITYACEGRLLRP
uniref:Bifunctional inhibitor/plant lipid transfer protein/seed storage helical domain-containing protein n=1 Tax=Manihot esculenta TaxID=3983 RepID=A0A2C9WQB5_MANES